MSKIKSGWIELYSLDNQFVTSKRYSSPKNRYEIVAAWQRKYPHQSFFIVLKPDLPKFLKNEYKD